MSKDIVQIVDGLGTSGLTPSVLAALDWVVPGKYQNVSGFTKFVAHVSGETDQEFIQRVGERAIALYNDKSQGYGMAMFIYRTVDEIGERSGQLALAGEMTEGVKWLSWLNRLTPKSETVQTFDFALKAGAEVVAFCQMNGLPGDNIGDFVKSLTDLENEALMRMAALICIDGILPLGPDFVDKAIDGLKNMSVEDANRNDKFKILTGSLPGGDTQGQLGFLREGLGHMGDWMKSFVVDRNVTQSKVLGVVEKVVGASEKKMDYLAAFLDMTCRYYEHTGAQSVARSLISRAVNEV
jgi:hypothetical protein